MRQRAGAAVLKRRAGQAPAAPAIELAHWSFGAAAGSASGCCPTRSAAGLGGPACGLAVWLGFELGVAPALGLPARQAPRPAERAAIVADHLLYGFVLSEFRARPQEYPDVTGRTGRRGVRPRADAGAVGASVQGVGFRPYVFRLAERARARRLRAERRARRACSRSRATPAAVERFARAAAARGAAAGRGRVACAGRAVAAGAASAASRSPRARAGGEAAALVAPDGATCDDCLAELLRPGRPALSLPVHQLHELRAALHDRARRPLRPAADDDGRLRDVRGVPGRVRGPARPALPRPAQRVPGLRAVGAAASRGWGGGRGRRSRCGRGARCATGAIVAVKGLGGYHLACRADDERPSAALRARKHREDRPFALMVARRRRRPRAGRARRRARRRCCAGASGRS